jgi:hypothetical protein
MDQFWILKNPEAIQCFARVSEFIYVPEFSPPFLTQQEQVDGLEEIIKIRSTPFFGEEIKFR